MEAPGETKVRSETDGGRISAYLADLNDERKAAAVRVEIARKILVFEQGYQVERW